jgi:ribosomal protein L13E
MPAPILLSPLAWTALRYGAVAAVALYAARSRGSQPKDAEHDRTLDDLPEGIVTHPHKAEGESALHGHGRLRRVVRLGRGGPGVEIDAAGIARFRFRRVG